MLTTVAINKHYVTQFSKYCDVNIHTHTNIHIIGRKQAQRLSELLTEVVILSDEDLNQTYFKAHVKLLLGAMFSSHATSTCLKTALE